MAKTKTFKAYRDTRTGKFIREENASRRPATVVVERIPKVGRGDTSPKSSRALKEIDKRYGETFKRLAKR